MICRAVIILNQDFVWVIESAGGEISLNRSCILASIANLAATAEPHHAA